MAFRCPLAETAIKKCGRASFKSGTPATMHEIQTTAKLFRPMEGDPFVVIHATRPARASADQFCQKLSLRIGDLRLQIIECRWPLTKALAMACSAIAPATFLALGKI